MTTMKRARWMFGAAMVLAAGAAAAGPGLRVVIAPQTSPARMRQVSVRKAGHMPAATIALDAAALAALKKSLVQSVTKPPTAQPQNLTAPLTIDPTHPTGQVGPVWAGLAMEGASFVDWYWYEFPSTGNLAVKLHGLAPGALYLLDCAIDGRKSGGAIVPATANQVILSTADISGSVLSGSTTSSVAMQNGHFIYGFMNPMDGQDSTWIEITSFTGGDYYSFTTCTVHPS